MTGSPAAPTDLSPARQEAFRTASSAEAQARALAALSDADVVKLARSLEFEGLLEGSPPELLSVLRPRLRQVRPPRVLGVERLAWLPAHRFLADRPLADPAAPWIVPRRVLAPLWAALEAGNHDLVDQLRRRHLVALFDDDMAALDRVATQVGDLAAFFLNNADLKAVPGVQPGDLPCLAFLAQVLKWHRLIMPNVRYFQQVSGVGPSTVQSLRLHTNWYVVYERLEEQFDLYILYLFEMTAAPIDVIDAFPFHFDTLSAPDSLAAQWLAHRCDRLARQVAEALAKPPRSQPAETLSDMAEALAGLSRLTERLARVPLFTAVRDGKPVVRGVFDAIPRRVPMEHVERACDSYLDDLHDVMLGPPDKQARAARLLPRLSLALPLLLALADTGEKNSRAARARFRLGEKVAEQVDRYLRNADLAPQARRAMAGQVAPALELCRRFGMSEDAGALLRKLKR
ncbi:hypothetical protein HHL28_00290 [Aerophototrophica crusticola]|uniref:Uncharacterized protein n=1 Tax=Aerophototrophica crusticola TaxID=1709002 RepID=A0A858R302_9PROT|nr:hypothetical protein HHL28_00290 [Rhodospirillaceae bacterium B3]